jgi:hypothetical protein
MPTQDTTIEMTEYQVILVQPASRKILVIDADDGYQFPRVSILPWTRPAQQLQKAIAAAWNIHVILLDFLAIWGGTPFSVVAEILMTEAWVGLKPVALSQIHHAELSEQQREQLVSMLGENSNGHTPLSQVGWINEAIAWMESSTRKKLSSKRDIEQFSAGGGFALMRLHTTDNWNFWLKAAAGANTHELSITTYLSKLGTGYLPELISTKPAWNAWLMSGEAIQIPEIPIGPLELFRLLEDAVESMAELQMRAEGASLDLLDAGAFDQRTKVFEKHSAALFDYLEESMSMQTSTKVPRLEGRRIRELRTTFDEVCQCVAGLCLPETVVHGDINPGNIVTGVGHCQFIDWCETYLGNPLITLQHLLSLNKLENLEIRELINRLLRQKYRDVWATKYDPQWFEKGFVYMPLMAIASTLYGRGNWLNSPERNDPRRQSYARALARCMDRAARKRELLEALCE